VVRGAGRRLVWCVDDPTLVAVGDEAHLAAYRGVRDTLTALIEGELLASQGT
jgi:hypothetical protein